MLFLLAADGRIVCGRPRGSWASSQYTWSPMERWLPGGLAALPAETARIELVRQWLAAFGPGTVADLRWWTGLSAAQVRQALGAIGPVEVDLGGGTGIALPDDLAPPPEPDPWVALLPVLDPTPMGWTQRSWYLGEHAPVVGGCAQRPDGEVVYRLLEDIGAEAPAAVERAAARLTAWTQPVRVLPRFRTPLERGLDAA